MEENKRDSENNPKLLQKTHRGHWSWLEIEEILKASSVCVCVSSSEKWNRAAFVQSGKPFLSYQTTLSCFCLSNCSVHERWERDMEEYTCTAINELFQPQKISPAGWSEPWNLLTLIWKSKTWQLGQSRTVLKKLKVNLSFSLFFLTFSLVRCCLIFLTFPFSSVNSHCIAWPGALLLFYLPGNYLGLVLLCDEKPLYLRHLFMPTEISHVLSDILCSVLR